MTHRVGNPIRNAGFSKFMTHEVGNPIRNTAITKERHTACVANEGICIKVSTYGYH